MSCDRCHERWRANWRKDDQWIEAILIHFYISMFAGMTKERTAHACLWFERSLARSSRYKLREHLFLQTDPICLLILQQDIKSDQTSLENISKFQRNDDSDAAVSPHVNSFCIPVSTSGTMPPYILRDWLNHWVQCLFFIDTGRSTSGHVPWYGKVHYAPFVRASMRQSRNCRCVRLARTSDDT